MNIVRFACLACLVLGVAAATVGQEGLELPADPSAYPSIMEIRPDYQTTEEQTTTGQTAPENPYRAPVEVENPYRATEEVAQATKPATTLAPPVVRGKQPPVVAVSPVVSNGPSVPPEFWFYSEQVRRHDDPAQAVRRKAELRAEQRMSRIAAMKWFGFSNSRPQASPIPMMGGYSPAWIGNGVDRYDWVGVSWPTNAVLVEAYNYDVRR